MKLYIYKSGWVKKKARQTIGSINPEKVKSIAVIRHAALGDMVLTRPFLIELRNHFPNAVITLSVVSNYTRGLPEDLVDRVHIFPGSNQREKTFFQRIMAARELGRQDIIFDLAASSRSYFVCALNRAPLKVGFPNEWYRHFFFYDLSIDRSDLKFEAEVLLEMLNVFGFRTEFPLRYKFKFLKKDVHIPYLVYFPGASVAYKRWPAESFSELIAKMAVAFPGFNHCVLQGIGEDESVNDLMKPVSHLRNVEVAKINDLQETIDFIGNASLVVSNCTGIRHLAISAGTPTVGLYFSAGVFRYWPRDGLHDVVFNADCSIPSVANAFRITEAHLKKVTHL